MFYAREASTGAPIALKWIVAALDSPVSDCIRTEVNLMARPIVNCNNFVQRRLRHKNIVAFHDAQISSIGSHVDVLIAMELCAGNHK